MFGKNSVDVRTLGRAVGTVVSLRSPRATSVICISTSRQHLLLGKRLELGLPEAGAWLAGHCIPR